MVLNFSVPSSFGICILGYVNLALCCGDEGCE